MKSTITVGVIFGGRSVEHDVSIVTAHQGMDALRVAGYSVLPIYITKSGGWLCGTPLHDLKLYANRQAEIENIDGVHRLSLSTDSSIRQLVLHPAHTRLFKRGPVIWPDVFFPMVHGTYGEDGTLQGALEMCDVPYVGCGVLAAAIGMDKAMAKRVAMAAGVPVLDGRIWTREEVDQGASALAESVRSFPVMVKPVRLGSSIGVRRCEDKAQFIEALRAAVEMDDRVLVERALTSFIEINCAVIGPPSESSLCEQPEPREKVLSFKEKYLHDDPGRRAAKILRRAPEGMAGLARRIPAPIPQALTTLIQRHAKDVFEAIGAAGVARVDFLFDATEEKLYFNEINTLPGSLAYYLWEPSGVPFERLVTKLVEGAMQRYERERRTVRTYESGLLDGM